MSDVILETQQLTRAFKGFTTVGDINLQVQRGHIHVLIGPNGAGKTTRLNVSSRFLEPTTGTILFNGRDITAAAPAEIARQGIVRPSRFPLRFPSQQFWKTLANNSFYFWAKRTQPAVWPHARWPCLRLDSQWMVPA